VVRVPQGKEKITIRLDSDILNWFPHVVDESGGGNYQSLINNALREYIEGKTPGFEDILRRVVREKLKRHSAA
jgi:uncharacterized protein (DUF4415 family)